MKKLGLLFLLTLLTACASRPNVTTDYDASYNFSALKSFSIAEVKQASAENLLISPFTFSHIHSAIEQEFGQHYQLVNIDDKPDFIIHYHVVLEEKLDASSYDNMYGYYGFGYRGFSSIGIGRTFGGPRSYNQGNLIIDLEDANTGKPIWRGVSAKRLRNKLNPEQQRSVLIKAVHEVMLEFPPAR